MKNLIMTMALALCLMVPGAAFADAFAGSVAASDQQQAQGQVQSSSSRSAGGSVVDSGKVMIKGSFNGAAPIRYLPVPSAVPMENYQGQWFGGPSYADKGPNFISMRQLIAAMNAADLKSDVKTKRLTMNIQIMGKAKAPKDAKPRKVTFELNDGETVNDGFKPIATVTVVMKKTKGLNSASLAMALGQKAQGLNASRCVFLTEGSTKKLESGGWGIGFSYNHATIGSKPSDSGSVGAGGTGYSRGWAKHSDLVYLTAILGN